MKFCRIPGERHPRWHAQAVMPESKPIRFQSELGWRNYKAAELDHDPADAGHFDLMFQRYVRDTKTYRQERKLDVAKHRGKAHCHKTQWLMDNKTFIGHECLLFPCMVVHRPEQVKYNYRDMNAARAMLLMTQGRSSDPKALAVHKCGNGHLSCVNPAHLKWGSPSDNNKDAVLHNAPSEFIAGMDAALVDEIRSSQEMVKVIAERTNIPAGVVSAIKLGVQFIA